MGKEEGRKSRKVRGSRGSNALLDTVELRRRAEEKARAKEEWKTEAPSLEECRRMLHEQQVYELELQMQNEELRKAQAELDASRARYFDLYHLAPVGYVTITE